MRWKYFLAGEWRKCYVKISPTNLPGVANIGLDRFTDDGSKSCETMTFVVFACEFKEWRDEFSMPKKTEVYFRGLHETPFLHTIYQRINIFFINWTKRTSHLPIYETDPKITCKIQNKCELVFIKIYLSALSWPSSSDNLSRRFLVSSASFQGTNNFTKEKVNNEFKRKGG